MSSLLLRPFQAEALTALEKPAHVLCIAATGAGKSLIYERRATLPGTRTLLITPLVALARQQEQKLRRAGLTVSLGAGPQRRGPPETETGVWIVSPESLRNTSRLSSLRKWKANFLVVDECHCLWDWGEAFRPAFLDIPGILQSANFERSLWLTATLPSSAKQELRDALSVPLIEIGRFALPKRLSLSVRRVPLTDRAAELIRFAARKKKSGEHGIVFAQSRNGTERIHRLLQGAGLLSAAYHAGMSSDERQAIESQIRDRRLDVVVATSAFGMGMDHSHLRWSVLWQAPPSLLALAQAIGRATRDLEAPSEALIYWDEEDFRMLEWILGASQRRRAELLAVKDFVRRPSCRKLSLENYFNKRSASSRCDSCDFCRAIASFNNRLNN